MINFFSGEFFLRNRANGGAVVLARSLWVTVLTYGLALFLKEVVLRPHLWQFDAGRLRGALAETLPWFGAIFAGAYAALYTRFASQWSYLAGLYNQIMAAKVQTSQRDAEPQRALNFWEAGFCEDAEELHLALKPLFAGVVISMLKREAVCEAYAQGTAAGRERCEALRTQCQQAFDEATAKKRKRLGLAGEEKGATSPKGGA